MLLKAQNRGLPGEVWSPTGQRLHHLIGLLPDTPQAFLLLMSFKAERHLTCLPTLRAELICTALKEREMRIQLMGVTWCHLQVVTSSAEKNSIYD